MLTYMIEVTEYTIFSLHHLLFTCIVQYIKIDNICQKDVYKGHVHKGTSRRDKKQMKRMKNEPRSQKDLRGYEESR